MQEDKGVHHLVVEDTVGVGVGGMFAQVAAHYDEIVGRYAYFLCDDDALADRRVVADFRDFLCANDDPEVIMCRMMINGEIFPRNWGSAPACGQIGIGCYIVKSDVWKKHPFPPVYEGDYHFIASVWSAARDMGYRIVWWDRVVSRTQTGLNQGRSEAVMGMAPGQPIPAPSLAPIGMIGGECLILEQALFGVEGAWVDVTEIIRGTIRDDTIFDIRRAIEESGVRDPAFGVYKSVRLTGTLGGQPFRLTVPSSAGREFAFGPPPPARSLTGTQS